MATFHDEAISEIDVSNAAATLKDPEFKTDLGVLRGYLVKVSMKRLVEASCWSFPVTREHILDDLFSRLETGELDGAFDISIEEISMDEVKQLVEQQKKIANKHPSVRLLKTL